MSEAATHQIHAQDATHSVHAQGASGSALQALREENDALRARCEQLESFAYVAAHDMQEPLRMIAGYLQLLERRVHGHIDEQAFAYLTQALHSAGRMHDLIGAILAWARLEAGARARTRVRLETVLAEALAPFASVFEDGQASLTHDALPQVYAAGPQIYQLFQNLLSNAVKFRVPGTPVHIHVTAQQSDGFWRIGFEDNGPGLPAEQREKIFDLFERLRPNTHEGSGIGLAHCRRIVELHGGRLWCEQAVPQGCRFLFTLPIREEAA